MSTIGASLADRLGRVRVILCDADGNLFPSEEPAFVASAQVTNRFLAAYGVDRRYDAEELRLATTGLNFRSTAVVLALAGGVGVEEGLVPDSATVGATVDPSKPVLTAAALQQWVDEEKRAVIDYLRTVLRPDPDVLEPLTFLAGRYGVAAVSSSADERIAACFEVTGMSSFFPPGLRFSAEDSLPQPTSKPDPAIYRFAGEQLGLDVTEGVAIEDSIPGATSAVAAGFPTIGNVQFVAADERPARRQALIDVGVITVIESWREVVDLLPSPTSGS